MASQIISVFKRNSLGVTNVPNPLQTIPEAGMTNNNQLNKHNFARRLSVVLPISRVNASQEITVQKL